MSNQYLYRENNALLFYYLCPVQCCATENQLVSLCPCNYKLIQNVIASALTVGQFGCRRVVHSPVTSSLLRVAIDILICILSTSSCSTVAKTRGDHKGLSVTAFFSKQIFFFIFVYLLEWIKQIYHLSKCDHI